MSNEFIVVSGSDVVLFRCKSLDKAKAWAETWVVKYPIEPLYLYQMVALARNSNTVLWTLGEVDK